MHHRKNHLTQIYTPRIPFSKVFSPEKNVFFWQALPTNKQSEYRSHQRNCLSGKHRRCK